MTNLMQKKKRTHWTNELVLSEALKSNNRKAFAIKSPNAYAAARRKKILDFVCSHMPEHVDQSGMNNGKFKWTYEMLKNEALKYSTKEEFKIGNSNAHKTIYDRKLVKDLCSHMPEHADQSGENSGVLKWTIKKLQEEALKYNTRNEFKKKSPNAHKAACTRKLMDKICKHMKRAGGSSLAELELLSIIKEKYPSAKKNRNTKIKIKDKPYIHEFEIDIFIQELNKGFEYDGERYHSADGLIKYKSKKWPIEAALNKHQIKDDYFASKGIRILHIKEKDWIKNKAECIEKCFNFLNRG